MGSPSSSTDPRRCHALDGVVHALNERRTCSCRNPVGPITRISFCSHLERDALDRDDSAVAHGNVQPRGDDAPLQAEISRRRRQSREVGGDSAIETGAFCGPRSALRTRIANVGDDSPGHVDLLRRLLSDRRPRCNFGSGHCVGSLRGDGRRATKASSVLSTTGKRQMNTTAGSPRLLSKAKLQAKKKKPPAAAARPADTARDQAIVRRTAAGDPRRGGEAGRQGLRKGRRCDPRPARRRPSRSSSRICATHGEIQALWSCASSSRCTSCSRCSSRWPPTSARSSRSCASSTRSSSQPGSCATSRAPPGGCTRASCRRGSAGSSSAWERGPTYRHDSRSTRSPTKTPPSRLALPDMDDVMDDLQKELFRAIFVGIRGTRRRGGTPNGGAARVRRSRLRAGGRSRGDDRPLGLVHGHRLALPGDSEPSEHRFRSNPLFRTGSRGVHVNVNFDLSPVLTIGGVQNIAQPDRVVSPLRRPPLNATLRSARLLVVTIYSATLLAACGGEAAASRPRTLTAIRQHQADRGSVSLNGPGSSFRRRSTRPSSPAFQETTQDPRQLQPGGLGENAPADQDRRLREPPAFRVSKTSAQYQGGKHPLLPHRRGSDHGLVQREAC